MDEACSLLERAAGVKLHRDPSSEKVKFLALGRWRKSLQQQDLPEQCQYIILSDHLDFVGVELRAAYPQTRRVNGEQMVNKVRNTINPWKAGKFMPLTMRPHSLNTYALSKVWYRCSCINLRVSDINSINSLTKSWLYQDLLEKPTELVMYRKKKDGGLGVQNVGVRAMALMYRLFLETAANPSFRHNLFHETLFRYHVEEEHSLPNLGFTPYCDRQFFEIIFMNAVQ